MTKYEIIFLEWAKDFLDHLDSKTRKKVLYNVWKSRDLYDPELFKKLDGEIWEFKTKYSKRQIRLLAFWDKSDNRETLVVATNGFIKKTQKTPKTEIEKAENIRLKYFKEKEDK
jgi:phage-related protein